MRWTLPLALTLTLVACANAPKSTEPAAATPPQAAEPPAPTLASGIDLENFIGDRAVSVVMGLLDSFSIGSLDEAKRSGTHLIEPVG